MPTIWYEDGFRFSFYAADGGEPAHVHVFKDRGTGKWWLRPIRRAKVRGFTRSEVLAVERVIRERHGYLLERWDDFFPAGEG